MLGFLIPIVYMNFVHISLSGPTFQHPLGCSLVSSMSLFGPFIIAVMTQEIKKGLI